MLNSLLRPDHAIQISLTTTLPSSTTTTNFPVVDNAVVTLYEDDTMVGNLIFLDSLYSIDYYPKVGHTYLIEAAVPGYPTVRASDMMPPPPSVVICFREDTADRYQFSDAILNVAIHDPAQEANAYWLDRSGLLLVEGERVEREQCACGGFADRVSSTLIPSCARAMAPRRSQKAGPTTTNPSHPFLIGSTLT